jgi:GNAT superfamily N-acetyltransferase
VIRQLQRRDLPAAESIKRAAVTEIWAPHVPLVARHLSRPGGRLPGRRLSPRTLVGAFVGGHLVGIAGTGRNAVLDLWVASAWRGRGLGTLLLARVERRLARQGVRVAYLRTAPFATAAVSLYLKRGWRLEKRLIHAGTHHTILRFAKRLR